MWGREGGGRLLLLLLLLLLLRFLRDEVAAAGAREKALTTESKALTTKNWRWVVLRYLEGAESVVNAFISSLKV
jgi:hypothetical protein